MTVVPINSSGSRVSCEPTKSTLYAWQVVAMLWWVCFFNYADRQAIFSVFPLISTEFRLNPVQLGLLGSAFAWVYALAGPVAGIVVDQIRYKSAILVGLEIWSLICAATALSRRFTMLLLFRAAEGLGESIYFPASMSMLAAYHPASTRSKAFGIHQTSIYAGTVAGGLVAGWLGQYFGWRTSFIVFGGLGVLLGIVLARFLREPERQIQSAPHSSFSEIFRFARLLANTPAALLLVLSFGAINFVAMVQLVWMPSYLYERFHLTLAQAGFFATSIAQGGAAIGSVLGGVLADQRSTVRGGRISVQIGATLLGIPFVYLCGLRTDIAITLLALGVWGFAKGLYDANTFASLFDELPPSMRGVSTGFMNSSGWLLGGTTAPIVMGFLAMHHDLGYAIRRAAAGYVIAAVLLSYALYLSRQQRHSVSKY